MKSALVVVLLLISSLTWSAPNDASIYQLAPSLTDQSNHPLKFDVYRGHPTLITMFYGSCPNVCPLIFETAQGIEGALNAAQKSQLRVLFISIDPDRDTPAALTGLAKVHHVDLSRWSLARANANDVRKIAALLNVQYRKLPNGDFNHSSVITLLDANGKIIASTSKLGAPESSFITALQEHIAQ